MLPAPDLSACRARRDRISAGLGQAALLLHGGERRVRSHDTEYRFRPDSNFYYLTGLAEPDAVMLLRPGRDPGLVLFIPDQGERDRLYHGPRTSLEEARATYGADAAFLTSQLPTELRRLLDGVDEVYLPFGTWPSLERASAAAIEALRAGDRRGEVAPTCLRDARALLGEDRIVKDEAALAALRRALEVTAAGHAAGLRAARPGRFEREVEAAIEHEFLRRGAAPGYETIVAAGVNATVLHYVRGRAPLRAGELLLIDAGAEWDLFTGDVTRTFPIAGEFSPAQRDVYAIVLAANEAGIAASTCASTFDEVHAACLRVLCEGLREIGALREGLDEVIERELYKPYCPHKSSHWLGADVHDAGRYTIDRRSRPLRPGFVLTVEPGIYFPASDEALPAELRGIGVRVEDDVLVTTGAPEVLSAAVPKRIGEIEALVARAREDGAG